MTETRSEQSPRAAEYTNRHVHAVAPEMTLGEVVSFLLHHDISSAPVVETIGERTVLVGFISERDCLEYLSNEAFYGSPSMPQTVRTMMRRHPVCVTPETELFALVSVFVHHGFRHLPVVDEDHHLLGIVSRRDILKALEQYYHRVVKAHDREHFPPDLGEIIHQRFIVAGR